MSDGPLSAPLPTARYAHADKMNSFALQFLFTPLRVGEQGISTVDDHVAFLEQRRQLSDHGIDRRVPLLP